jgi:hypothetical protein
MVKKLACAFAGLLAFAGNVMGEVIIGPGNTYVFDFNLTYSRPSNSLDGNCALVSFSRSFQSFGGRMDYFSNSVLELPFLSHPFGAPGSDPVDIGYGFGRTQPPPWPDLQGVIRVTVLSGVAHVEKLSVTEIVNGGLYSGTFLAVVPEPSTYSLLMIGIVWVGKSMWRLRRI